jgi:hypothetical protein
LAVATYLEFSRTGAERGTLELIVVHVLRKPAYQRHDQPKTAKAAHF